MKRVLLLALAFILLISSSALASDGNVYENHDYKFRITLPDDWKIKQTRNATFQVFEARSPGGFPRLAVFAQKVAANNSFEALIKGDEEKLIKQFLKATPMLKFKEKSHIKIATYDALRVVLVNNQVYNMNYFFTCKDYNIIVITMGGLENFTEEEQLLDQVVFTLTFFD